MEQDKGASLRDRATHEEWRRFPVSPYRNYEVSSLGRVRRGGRVLAPVGNGDGYATVKLSYAGIAKRFRINRLVCETFHGPPPFPGADAAHEDGDRAHNAAANLAWKDRKSNIADKLRHGTHQSGEAHGGAKLTAMDVQQIRSRRAGGETLKALAADFGVSDAQIARIGVYPLRIRS